MQFTVHHIHAPLIASQRNSLLRVTFSPTSLVSGPGNVSILNSTLIILIVYREGGDPSKARDYLPSDKQYLITHGVPCLRRATSLAYTDADEDAERLLSFGGDASAAGGEDEWVETHAGRKPGLDSVANAGEIDDIPDLDGPGDHDLNVGVAALSLDNAPAISDIPDMDDIPDMEEDDLEDGDEATAAPKAPAAAAAPQAARYRRHNYDSSFDLISH